jgi:hypothetical protein
MPVDFNYSGAYSYSVGTAFDNLTELTVAAWIWADTYPATNMMLVTHKDYSTDLSFGLQYSNFYSNFFWEVAYNDTNDTDGVRYQASNSTGVWYHLLGRWSTTNRDIWRNGAQGDTNTTSRTSISDTAAPVIIGDEYVSGSPNGSYWNGRIAEATIWTDYLNSSEIVALAAGVHPLSIRRNNIGFYAPLYNTTYRHDLSGAGYSASILGSGQTNADAPPVAPYVPQVWILMPAAAGVGDLTINVSDNVEVSESVTVDASDPAVTAQDDATVTDSVTAEVTTDIGTQDDATVTDTTTVSVSDPAILSTDNTTVADSVNLSVSDLQIGVQDDATLTDSDTVTIVEVGAISIVAQDDATLTDSVTVSISPSILTTDNITVSDSVNMAVSDLQIGAQDDATITDSPTVTIGAAGEVTISVQDDATVTDTVILAASTAQITISDDATVTDSATVDIPTEAALSVNISPQANYVQIV